jgi:hypothetical protein
MTDRNRLADEKQPEAWMRGIVAGVNPVVGHLIQAAEQIREDADTAIGDLTPAQVWSRPNGMTSAGFHAKHLAGSTGRLSTYLAGQQLTSEQLSAIDMEAEGEETSAELLAFIDAALDSYRKLILGLPPEDFDSVREIGRKRYEATAIGVAIHIVEHAQRHIGGMIAAAKLARAATA